MTTPTPTLSQRTRHDPTPRDPAIPKTMRVTVEVGFVQSCPDCRAIVGSLSTSCIGDSTVTRFAAVPGRVHAHEVTEGSQSLPGLSTASQMVPQELICEHQTREGEECSICNPPSDTNGSHPDDVGNQLFASGPTVGESDRG